MGAVVKGPFLAVLFCLVWAGPGWAHGDISKLPDPIQIMQYRLLIHMNSEDLVSRNRLAMALYRTGELDAAREQLHYVLRVDGNDFDALDGMGIVLMRMGRCTEALEYLEKAEHVREGDIMLHVHLAVVQKALGQGRRAEEELNKARNMAPGPDVLSEIDQELVLVGPPGGGCE